MRIRWLIPLALFTVGAIPAPAAAVTVQDLIELTRAGLGDEVLVALVETSGAVYTLTTEDLVQLKHSGVSERVIVTMLRQGRARDQAGSAETAPAASVPAYGPTSWRSDRPWIDPSLTTPMPAAPSTVVVVPAVVAFPVVVPSPPPGCTKVRAVGPVDRSGGFGRFINDGFREGTPIGVWGPVNQTCPSKPRK